MDKGMAESGTEVRVICLKETLCYQSGRSLLVQDKDWIHRWGYIKESFERLTVGSF